MDHKQGNSPEVSSWDERYNRKEYVYGEQANIFLQEFSHLFPPSSRVATYAEGEGRNAVFLARQGLHVTAYDLSKIGLNKTKILASKHNVSINTVQHDLMIESLPIARYDAAVMIFGHFPQTSQNKILGNILDSLKPGGRLFMELYEEEQINYNTGGPKDITWLYNNEDLLKWAKQQKVLHFFTGEVVRSEGLYHKGKCYVVQLIVEKLNTKPERQPSSN